jgi:integrase
MSATRKVAGLTLALAAISQVHKAAGFASPRGAAEVQEVMKGIRRSLGVAQVQKAPILLSDLRAMVEALPIGLAGLRDRALLLVGFAGAFRRSELVALDIRDVNFAPEGLEVTLRRSKTDQEGVGRKIGLPYGSNPSTCPVRALQAWLNASAPQGTTSGPIFREVRPDGRTVMVAPLTGQSVALIVKKAATGAGLDPAKFSGHSLRAGLATSAAKAGKSERAIMAQTGHRSEKMVRRYIRDASLFDDNAASGIGL